MPKAAIPKPVKAKGAPGLKVNFKRLLKNASEINNMNNEETVIATAVEYASVPTDIDFLNDNNELEKDAAPTLAPTAPQVAASPFKTGLYSALGTALAGGLVAAGFAAYDKYQERKSMQNAYRSLQQAIVLSPALKRYDIATLESYLPMIVKASPTVATDPRLLANYLESMLDAEGHLNLGTFRELSGLENTVLSNNALNNPFRTELVKGLGKGTGQNVANGFVKGFGDTMGDHSKQLQTQTGAVPTTSRM